MSDSHDAANLEAMGAAVAYQAAMAALVHQHLAPACTGESQLLDFGAGRGDYAALLQSRTGRRVVGFEPDAALHAHFPADVRALASLTTCQELFQGAYSLNVLEHIEDDVAALRSLAGQCAPGAPIFILVPANPGLWTSMDARVGHCRRYTPETLAACIESAGLQVEAQGWFDRTGYCATRAFQLLGALRKERQPGMVSTTQVRAFDRLFSVVEPFLSATNLPFGKNCWARATKPV